MANIILSDSQANNLPEIAKVAVSCFVHKNYNKFFNELDIEDLTGETVLKALRYWASFDSDKASFKTWVSRIAKSVVLDDLDHRRKRSDLNWDMYPICDSKGKSVNLSVVVGANELLFYRGDEFDADRDIITDEFIENVRERESILSERDRSIWEMLKDGFKPRDIAEMTGMSANAVSIRKHYIIEALRPRMLELAREYDVKIENVSC